MKKPRRSLSTKSLIQPAKKTTSAAELKAEIDAWINSREFAEECRQAHQQSTQRCQAQLGTPRMMQADIAL